jgi:hypothetical protein
MERQIMVFTLVFTKAMRIRRTLGTFIAARFLFNRGVSIETALYLLTIKHTDRPYWAVK